MKYPIALIIFVTSFYHSFFAQTLTISASGQTGTSGTNWYVSGSNPVRIIGTQTANVNTSVVQSYINSGVDVLIFSVGEISIQNDLTKTNSGRLILRPANNSVSGSGKIILGNNAQLLLSNGATISNLIELNSGTSTIGFAPVEIEYLIVGGGASGGVGRGGGGGAGGVLTGSIDATSTSYSITVGSGGAAVTHDNRGNNGGNSAAFGFTAYGGGGGGGWLSGFEPGLGGGSGGGASASPFVAGNGISGQGNNGFWLNWYREEGGGGGGAANAATNQNGGNGISSTISGTQLWYGGGGGAGALGNGWQPAGLGGLGGGGNGNKIAEGTAASGAANTGGGGGGSEGYNGWSGAGGTGVVLLRYLGADISSGGTEYAGSNAALGYVVHQYNNVGTYTFSISQSTFSGTISGVISGSGNLILNPLNGTLTLTGNNTYSGSTTIQSGNIQVGNNGTNGSLGTGNIVNNSTITFLRSNTLSMPGVISGSGSLVQQGAGNVILSQNNTYTGTTTISSGTLTIGNNTTTGTFGTGSVINNSALSINRSNDLTITNTISGTGTLTKEALNSVTLTQNNTYAGNNTINAGILVLQNNTPNPTNKTFNGTGQLRIEPASTSFTTAFTTSGWVFNSTLTGLALGKANNAANITIGAAVSINGPITIYGGDLTLNAALSTTNNTTGNINLNGAKLLGAGDMNLAIGRILTTNLSTSSEYTGAISGSNLQLDHTGSGSLTLNSSAALNFQTVNINAGGLVLAANKQLTVTGTLTNNAVFTLKNNATFVQASTGTSIAGTGTFTVEKALTGNAAWTTTTGRFWYMGVPMISVLRNSFGSYDANANRLWSYSESTKTYTEITTNTALSAGTGYVHRRTSDGTLTFSATGTNGLSYTDHTISGLTRTSGSSVGFNLISNPYMAYLDWDAVVANTNTGTSNIEPTYYLRSHNSTANDISALITYNALTGLESNNSSISNTVDFSYLAPLQAIWVRVGTAASTGSLAMTRSMLTHQATNPGLKSSTIFPTLARVNLVDGARFDQMLVYLNQDMTNAVDQYDSEKMFVSGAPQLYTMAAGKKLVMNGLNSNKKKISVPVYLELPESKVYNLQLADYKLEDGLILLEDKQEGTIQDFTIHDTYAFYANSGVLQNRFVLHFYMPDATITAQGPSNSWAAEEGSYTEGGNILISSDPKGKVAVTLELPEDQQAEGNIQVTDANGRVVYSGALEGLTTEFQLNVPSGVYYLTVQSGNIIENKKVFIQD